MKLFTLFYLFSILLFAETNTTLFKCVKLCPEEQIIQELKRHTEFLGSVDMHRDTLLHYAVRYKRYKLLRYLVKQEGVDVAAIGANHKTPVDIAIDNNDTLALRYLMLSPTFNRVLYNKRVRTFLLEHQEEDEFFDDFEDIDSLHNDFSQELQEFTTKIKRKSLYDKKRKLYMKSESHIDKNSKNRGNINILIK